MSRQMSDSGSAPCFRGPPSEARNHRWSARCTQSSRVPAITDDTIIKTSRTRGLQSPCCSISRRSAVRASDSICRHSIDTIRFTPLHSGHSPRCTPRRESDCLGPRQPSLETLYAIRRCARGPAGVPGRFRDTRRGQENLPLARPTGMLHLTVVRFRHAHRHEWIVCRQDPIDPVGGRDVRRGPAAGPRRRGTGPAESRETRRSQRFESARLGRKVPKWIKG